MLGLLARSLLFVSAYIPLFIVTAILGWSRFGYWSLIPLGIGIFGLFGLALVQWYVAGTAHATLTVHELRSRDGDVVPYLLGYLIPLIELDFQDDAKIWAMLVIFLAIGATQIAANLIHLNPVLLLLGRHIYDIVDSDGVNHTVISKNKRMRNGQRLKVVTLTENYIHWTKNDD